MSPTVTIVVRTRNRPAMLRRALASINSQTYRNFEVVVVNDAGDETEVRSVIDPLDAAFKKAITPETTSSQINFLNVCHKLRTPPLLYKWQQL